MKTAKDLIIPFTWDERRPVQLDRFFYVPGSYEHTKIPFLFFEKEQPIIIEYCSGNGQWIGEKAKQFPHLNWLAVEKRFERARKIWLKSHRENLFNLFVICSEGLTFTQYYAPKVQEAFINFPDPWPKRRHAPLRIVRAEFLEMLGKIIDPGGKTTCVTDDAGYAKQIEREFAKCPEWKLIFNANKWPDYGKSYFNDLWTQKGRTIHYLSYEKK